MATIYLGLSRSYTLSRQLKISFTRTPAEIFMRPLPTSSLNTEIVFRVAS